MREAAPVKEAKGGFSVLLDGQALLVSRGSRGKSIALLPRQVRGMHRQPSFEPCSAPECSVLSLSLA